MSFGNHGEFSISLDWRILNQGKNDILVKQRAGVRYIIPRTLDPQWNNRATVIVTIGCYFPNRLNVCLDDAETPLDKELFKQLIEKVKTQEEGSRHYTDMKQEITLMVTLNASHESLEGQGVESKWLGLMIYPNLDEIGTKSPDTLNHGVTQLNQEIKEEFKNEVDTTEPILIINSFIKDRANKFNGLFTNLFGRAVQIPERRDSPVPDGLYITYRTRFHSPKNIYFRLDEITEDIMVGYGLYTSEFDAKKGGHNKFIQELQSKVTNLNKDVDSLNGKLFRAEADLDKVQNKDLVKLTHELDESKREITRIKNEAKNSADHQSRVFDNKLRDETDKLKATIRELEDKTLESCRQLLRLKEEYNHSKVRNKDTLDTVRDKASLNRGSEAVKAIVGIGGLFLGICKLVS